MTAPVTPTASSRRNPSSWLGLAVMFVGCLGLTEVALRLLDLPQALTPLQLVRPDWQDNADLQSDPDTFWRLAPTSSRFEANRLGLRGREPEPTTDERRFRIAVVGGSVAFGLGVQLDDTFAMRLARTAQSEAPGACIETLILGLPGGSSWQDARLWQLHGPAFAPNLLVIYGNMVEDMAAAANQPDAAVAHELANPSRWRLLRLWRRLWQHKPATAPALAVAGSNSPHGPRVPVDDFKRNLDALVSGARAIGAEVCVVLPALSSEVKARYPDMDNYRQALVDGAAAVKARTIDANALISNYANSMPTAPCADFGSAHGLRDGVHLSQPGHALLADDLMPFVRMHARFAALGQTRPAETPALTNVQPPTVDALAGAEVTFAGSGFTKAHALRLRIGEQSVGSLQVIDDHTLRARVPLPLTPGRHAIELTSDRGRSLIPVDIQLTVNPAKLDVGLRRDGGQLELRLQGQAAPGCRVQVWVSAAGRANPVDTPAGPFWLQFGDISSKPSRAPFCFASLPLPSFTATAGADGSWQSVVRTEPNEHLDRQAVFQGVAWLPDDTGRAVATDVVVRVVPH